MTVFGTERLEVGPWTHDDAERVFDMYSRWEVARWLGATPRALVEPDEAHAAIDRWASRSIGDDRFGVWAVRLRETGLAVGTVLLVPLPGDGGEVEVGWHFHPDSWGHGYATEAARGAIARGFAGGLAEIFAVVRPDNRRSLAVCRRLGMTPLGRTDRWYGTELEAYRIARPDHLRPE
jgi:RimJ/RimL family protein N-acetyltransferase